MSDPIDPNTGRGKKEDGWKTVVMKSPFADGGQTNQGPTGATPQYPNQQVPPPPMNHQAGAGGFPPPPMPGQGPGMGAPAYAPPQSYQSGPPSFPPSAPPYAAPYPGSANQGTYPAPFGQPVKKRKTWVWVLLIVLSVLLLGFVGCVAVLYKIGKSHMAVTPGAAVTLLHDRMKDKDAEAIYAAADPAYKERVSRSQSDAEFVRVKNLLGAPVRYQLLETRPRSASGEDVVDTFVLTTFEKGSANENMEWRRLGGEYKLVAYGIQSDNLR